MNEAEIASKLQQKLQPEPTQEIPSPLPEDKGHPGQATIAPELELDEITQYKLHQHFGENYREGDEVARKQLEFIYTDVAERIGSREYPFVVAKINELKRMLGLNHTDDARFKLYQWLKLDQKRSQLEIEMRELNG